MKSKRFTTLIAVLVISLLASVAAMGFTVAFAEGSASDYFTLTNGTAKVEGGNIVFDVTGDSTVTSKNEFYLPETIVNYTAENLTVSVNGEAYASGAKIGGEEGGQLVLSLKLNEGASAGKLTISSVTTNGKALYSIEDNQIKADLGAAYVADDFKFAKLNSIVWGYNYENVSFSAYHGFISNLKKEAVIVYGETEAACKAEFDKYMGDGEAETTGLYSYDVTSSATVKFTSNTEDGGVVMAYWGLTDGDAEYASKSLTVKKELEAKAPAYNNLEKFYNAVSGSSEYDAYLKNVDAALKTDGEYKYIGSSTYFTVPTAIYDYIESEYFANEDLTFVIYYKLPGSDSFTKLSSTSSVKRFALSKLGEYEYYVLATDPQNNSLEIDEEWEYKQGEVNGVKTYGYFNEEGVLQVPVFKFEMGNAGPQVTAGSSYQDPGYVGSTYTKVNSFTTKGNDISTVYTLWYNSNNSATEFSVEENSGWYEIGTEEAFDAVKERFNWKDEDFTTLAWNDSSLAFTPIATGSYVVRCSASDGEANTAVANTRVINVKSAVSRVTIDTVSVWFEQNWKSVLFLGIAVLSLIGIVVLLLVKPKEETEKTNK